MPPAASPGLALVSERPAELAEAIADVYGVAVYPLDLARAEAAVELHRRSAGSGLAVEISAASPALRDEHTAARALAQGDGLQTYIGDVAAGLRAVVDVADLTGCSGVSCLRGSLSRVSQRAAIMSAISTRV